MNQKHVIAFVVLMAATSATTVHRAASPIRKHTVSGSVAADGAIKFAVNMSDGKAASTVESASPIRKRTVSDTVLREDLDVIAADQIAEDVIDSVGPNILYDGKNIMTTTFQKLEAEFAEEYLFSVKADKFDIIVNGTHVLMPMGKKIQWNFIRRWHSADGGEDTHVGVLNQRFSENSIEILKESILASEITVGLAEKMHVLYTSKVQDTTAYDRAMEDQQEQDRADELKSDDFYERNLLTTIIGSATAPMMRLWNQVGGASQAIKDWANGGDPPDSFDTRASLLRQDMEITFKELKENGSNFSDPQFSSTNCYHWGNVAFDTSQELIFFPLGQKISSYRAHMVAAPYLSMSVTQGTSVFTYDNVTGLLEIYYGVSKESRVGDLKVEQPTGTVVLAPPDGEGTPIDEPIWSDQEKSIVTTKAYKTLLRRDLKYKTDWQFLFEDYDKICPPDHLANLNSYYDQLVASGGGHMAYMSKETAQAWLNLIQCATNFVKPDHVNGAEYNEFITGALMHGLLELPSRYVIPTFAARDWNDINVDLIPGAS